ncbi:MAG: carbamoyltransferase HypF [Cyanobacteria bacterium REEB67]|nr:carbamoyltransferase HypF [Cyanobacteria bacterium REEB67]
MSRSKSQSLTPGKTENPELIARLIRVRGTVQGVGFRPTVYIEARKHGVVGSILNDGEGVLIRAWGSEQSLGDFIESIRANCPPLGKIDTIEWTALESAEADLPPSAFEIIESVASRARTSIAADARTCAACLGDTTDPFSRRYRYPFTNCTHCGPRLSIIEAIPYDRPNTTMSAFPLCADCRAEYENPEDRRFHAQPNACYVCGPKVSLERVDGRVFSTESLTQLDDVDAAAGLILKGEIIAIKGLGGFHIACDATRDEAVKLLRQRKKRYQKPFALMARDFATIERYCHLNEAEKELLQSPAAPIVLLSRKNEQDLPAGARPVTDHVAPGQNRLGFMLPYTPLHHLLLKRLKNPIILTSANLSDEPQCTDNDEAKSRMGGIADYILTHNRRIANRIDDSVARVVSGQKIILRRARGYAPAPLNLPPGFEKCAEILAMGGELKNTFCLLKDGKALLSQHMGDLENAPTYIDYQKNLALYKNLFQSNPSILVVDKHPEYLSSKLGRKIAHDEHLQIEAVQHHHAHIASCLAEHHYPLNMARVLGIALDGLGYGENNELWGGEFLFCDYYDFERLGTFKPVAMLGGAQAMREPWRNTYAHIMAEIGWPRYLMDYEDLDLTAFLLKKALPTFASMLQSGTNSPQASSCGRLFDAVAAAVGICREEASYEGQAAIELEAIACALELENPDEELIYPFSIPRLKDSHLPYIEPIGAWQGILGDLIVGTSAAVISARFHKSLARVIANMAIKLSTSPGAEGDEERRFDTVVLTGGVFQNQLLSQLTGQRLVKHGFKVLTHTAVPANDGGLALGQALIAAARNQKGSS